MDDLLKLIAAEGLYQNLARAMLARGIILSRADFGRMQFPLMLGVDHVLALMKVGFPLALDKAFVPRADAFGGRPQFQGIKGN